MAIRQILEAFEGEETLPLPLSKVKNWICDQQLQDEIEFIPVELDTGIIRGFIHRFTYQKVPYGEAVRASNIYYGKDQGAEWINMVCAKELIHIADNGRLTSKREQVDELVRRLALPRDLDILLDDPEHVKVDKVGDVIAAAILLPLASRQLLLGPFKANAITVQDISELALMPAQYVRMVMSDRWERQYTTLKRL